MADAIEIFTSSASERIEVITSGAQGPQGPAGPAGATFDQDLNTTDAVTFASVYAPLYDAALSQPGAGVDDAVFSIYAADGTAKLDASGMTGTRFLALPDESGTLALVANTATAAQGALAASAVQPNSGTTLSGLDIIDDNPNVRIAQSAISGDDVVVNDLSVKFGDGTYTHTLQRQGTLAANATFTLPVSTGTLALTSDIPTTFAASAITSGTLGTARLGSGTASSGTWLRGDSTWQALPAAGSTNLWIAGSSFIPRTTNGCGVDSREQATNKINTDELLFDAAAIEYAQAAVVMPNNWNAGTVTAKFYWTASSGSGDVVWQIAGRALANDDALDQAMGTAQTATDTLTAANDMDISPATSAVTLAGSPAAGQLVIYEISRKATDAGDTLAVDARLLGVEISFN